MECRGGVVDSVQRFASLPVYLPVSYRLYNAEVSFFLKETNQDIMRNASLQSRTESFLPYKAAGLPLLNATYGPFTVEQAVPQHLLLSSSPFRLTEQFTFNWKLQSRIIDSAVYANRPKVQALFYLAGRNWEDYDPVEVLPCVRMVAFQEDRAVVGSCRLEGQQGLCVAHLEFSPNWFNPAATSALPPLALDYQQTTDSLEGITVELFYGVYAAEGECSSEDQEWERSLHPEGQEEAQVPWASMERIGSVLLYPTQDKLKKSLLSLDDNLVLCLPLSPVKEGDLVTFYVSLTSGSPADQFTLR